MIIVKPFIFVPATVIKSAEVNSDFDTIYNDYNGNVDQNNIATLTGTLDWNISTNISAITIVKSALGVGDVISITNAGTGKDMRGNAGNWFINPDGSATFAGLTVLTGAISLNNPTFTGISTFNGQAIFKDNVDIWNGFDLRTFSDAGVTQTAGIDGATGNITTSGLVDGIDVFNHDHSGGANGMPVDVAAATGILPVVNGGTGVALSTGTTAVVLSNNPTLVAPTTNIETFTQNSANEGDFDVVYKNNITGFWLKGLAAGGITSQHNITSAVKNAAGNYTITLSGAASTANYCIVGNALQTGAFNHIVLEIDSATITTTAFTIQMNNSGGNLDSDYFVMGVGLG